MTRTWSRAWRFGITGLAAVVLLGAAPAAAGQGSGDAATFTKDVAPILQRSCQSCHRPNSVAPMSLLTYEEVRPWARSIKQRTGLRNRMGVMPPWFIEKDVGIQDYKDDISLSEAEIRTLAAWADSGAPRGNAADLPPPLVFPAGDQWGHRPAGPDRRHAVDHHGRRGARLVGRARAHAHGPDRGPLRRIACRSRRSAT